MSVRIGDLALASGAVTAAQLEQARALQKTNGSRLGAALVGLGYVTEEQTAVEIRRKALEEGMLTPARGVAGIGGGN